MSASLSPLTVLAAGTSWRLFGLRRAGETLLQAMSEKDEQAQMLAGMSLVKAGRRSFDLIEEKIDSGQASAAVVRLLPDIDPQRARPLLERIVGGESGEVHDAARQCIELLDRIERSESAG